MADACQHRCAWTSSDDEKLLSLRASNVPLVEIAGALGRGVRAIESRLEVLKSHGIYNPPKRRSGKGANAPTPQEVSSRLLLNAILSYYDRRAAQAAEVSRA